MQLELEPVHPEVCVWALDDSVPPFATFLPDNTPAGLCAGVLTPRPALVAESARAGSCYPR